MKDTLMKMSSRTRLLRPAENSAPKLSPDGTRLIWRKSGIGLVMAGLDDLSAATVVADNPDSIIQHTWLSDSSHVAYARLAPAEHERRVWIYDTRAGASRPISPARARGRILTYDPRTSASLFVAHDARIPGREDLFRLSADGHPPKLDLVTSNPGPVLGWLVAEDSDGILAVRGDGSGGMVWLLADGPADCWRELVIVDPEDAATTRPLRFKDGRVWALSSIGRCTAALVYVDVRSGRCIPVWGHPRFDLGTAFWLNPDHSEPDLIGLVTDRPSTVGITAEGRLLTQCLAQNMNADIEMLGTDSDGICCLVAERSPAGSRSFVLYDREHCSRRVLLQDRPGIDQICLGTRNAFGFKARDGLPMNGYVTLPERTREIAFPTVLAVHSGPWTRDSLSFNGYAQWFAALGYACVQVDFRGSTGYGKAFVDAGDRQWAKGMQDDLIDALDFVIDQGWCDPKRVVVSGSSYGGYAALMALARNPDRFRGAISIAGLTDLRALFSHTPAWWNVRRELLYKRVGDPRDGDEELFRASPVAHADSIDSPILVAHGVMDSRVPVSTVRDFIKRTRPGIATYIEFEDEGHALTSERNLLIYMQTVEEFLRRLMQ